MHQPSRASCMPISATKSARSSHSITTTMRPSAAARRVGTSSPGWSLRLV